MRMKEKYSNIKKCPWCGVKPSLIIAPHGNTIMFDITLGCTNEKCKFNPTCHSSATVNSIDSFISEMIAEWDVRSDDKVPEPPKIEITVDTESKWTLSEALEEVKENETRCTSCIHHIVSENNKHWCKRYACGAWAALIGCQYKGFIDKSEQEEKTDNSDLTDENKCADCKHYWYCAGEECCNLDELSFPEPCNKFEREDYE